MKGTREQPGSTSGGEHRLSNADIANKILTLAQVLALQKENPFKIRAYRRAAKRIANLGESVHEMVLRADDLTRYPGIGKSIAGTIADIVRNSGSLPPMTQSGVGPEIAAVAEYPRLDAKRVARVYKGLGIASTAELKAAVQSGAIRERFGEYVERHFRRGLTNAPEMLLWDAHPVVSSVQTVLIDKGGATRAEAAGDYRRRLEVISELHFVIVAEDLAKLTTAMERYGGHSKLLCSDGMSATVEIPSGMHVRIERSTMEEWGWKLLLATGTDEHIRKLAAAGLDVSKLARSARLRTEADVYRKLGLAFVAPELREGVDEVERAAMNDLPDLVSVENIRGELHDHTRASDGAHTLEQMAEAARLKGYEYLGITDHSKSLTIAHGLSEEELWKQVRAIDRLNEAGSARIRILKSAEVDILEDGSLDFSDAVLKELDYTICSIHSKFGLGRTAQTERVMRAMDNRYFNIFGHATGRKLLNRPGYDLDFDRVKEHAKANGCFFEINSSPDRLDLEATNARLACGSGVKIAINTDAHSVREFDFISAGIEQARRAGLEASDVLNCLSLAKLRRVLKR